MIGDLASTSADAPDRLVRFGRRPNPLLLAPLTDYRWRGRFDDPLQRRRTLYAAERRLTCLFEKLQDLRPDPTVIFDLEQLRERALEEDPDGVAGFDSSLYVAEAGMVERSFFTDRAFVEFTPTDDRRWLDLREPAVLDQLRRRMMYWLVTNGIDDFDFGELVSRDKRVTQHIAGLAIDSGIDGIVSFSHPHPGAPCWCMFEGATIREYAITIPITPDDPDFRRVQQAWGIKVPPGVDPLENAGATVVGTGGVIRGSDELAIPGRRGR